ncbi:hypothetical protein B8V81_0041 [Paenibacillus pasadenensis]|uniref:Uncharacterized protein n=1 Tax=Paenibacillus pasadenensis TaxID=217090 RepID=A0A2N5NC33_9BACL|nr:MULTISPECIES: hypothetical protein [Paenibacillus]PLT47909.1 hypothetical protein B8V81_0041 [Paenibacillus pasadenensis]QGG54170.1 hypothetical protein GE073_00070 [Paenibacillus sp. B01]
MFQPLSEQKEATIYQYKLVRKLAFEQGFQRFYYISGATLALALLIADPWPSLLGLMTGFMLIPAMHAAIIRMALLRRHSLESTSRRWQWRWKLPFPGYMPVLPMELSVFQRLQLHKLWIGACAIGAFYPWLSPWLLSAYLLLHLWLLAPLVYAIVRLHKENRDGVIKLPFEEPFFSYYHR